MDLDNKGFKMLEIAIGIMIVVLVAIIGGIAIFIMFIILIIS